MLLEHLIEGLKIKRIHGAVKTEVNDLQFDSREVKEGDVFFAIRGVTVDGHKFIEKAVHNGAWVVVAEEEMSFDFDGVFLLVEDCADILGKMVSRYFNEPSGHLKLIGITGTNGKTTTATLLHDLFSGLGYKSGLISTVEIRIGNQILPTAHTTPDPIRLNKVMAEMIENDCDYVFMEVSSHAIQQKRIAGLKFAGAVFTNITHEHLDYHGDFRNYIECKKMFFDNLDESAFALTNVDDKRGTYMLQNTVASRYQYALHKPADYKGKILENSLYGLLMLINDTEFNSRLIGDFNAYNLLCCYAVADLLGLDKFETLVKMSELSPAEGRFEILSGDFKVTGIVDYAHTPDALKNVLMTINSLKPEGKKLITVFGCGGNRDKAKRPLMGKIATMESDRVILTNDNPRNENPEKILEDIQSGIDEELKRSVLKIPDRKEAIKTAVALSSPGDIILVAGKGHEKYQEVLAVKNPFDDKKVLKEALNNI